jgi:protein-disulfide isomerase
VLQSGQELLGLNRKEVEQFKPQVSESFFKVLQQSQSPSQVVASSYGVATSSAITDPKVTSQLSAQVVVSKPSNPRLTVQQTADRQEGIRETNISTIPDRSSISIFISYCW